MSLLRIPFNCCKCVLFFCVCVCGFLSCFVSGILVNSHFQYRFPLHSHLHFFRHLIHQKLYLSEICSGIHSLHDLKKKIESWFFPLLLDPEQSESFMDSDSIVSHPSSVFKWARVFTPLGFGNCLLILISTFQRDLQN